jgi:hypothetical protein
MYFNIVTIEERNLVVHFLSYFYTNYKRLVVELQHWQINNERKRLRFTSTYYGSSCNYQDTLAGLIRVFSKLKQAQHIVGDDIYAY